jgi:pyruvate kinase
MTAPSNCAWKGVTDTDIVTRVINGGSLGERKGINLPGVKLQIPSLTEKDREDLKWAAGQGVDYFALSFVRSANDCTEAKDLIKAAWQQSAAGRQDRES